MTYLSNVITSLLGNIELFNLKSNGKTASNYRKVFSSLCGLRKQKGASLIPGDISPKDKLI